MINYHAHQIHHVNGHHHHQIHAAEKHQPVVGMDLHVLLTPLVDIGVQHLTNTPHLHIYDNSIK